MSGKTCVMPRFDSHFALSEYPSTDRPLAILKRYLNEKRVFFPLHLCFVSDSKVMTSSTKGHWTNTNEEWEWKETPLAPYEKWHSSEHHTHSHSIIRPFLSQTLSSKMEFYPLIPIRHPWVHPIDLCDQIRDQNHFFFFSSLVKENDFVRLEMCDDDWLVLKGFIKCAAKTVN